MIVLIDSGNSRMHVGWWVNGFVAEAVSIPYPDSPALLAGAITRLIGGRTVEKAAACSVNSRWRQHLFMTLRDSIPGELHVAVSAADIGLSVRYDNQSLYGIDRALAAFAAYRHYRDSCVVIDIGTAVTVDAVSSDGTVAGGYIFPGVPVLSRCLSGATDLPSVTSGDFAEGIGTSTEGCMEYGISMGLAGAVERLAEFAEKTVGSSGRVMMTGGGAQMLVALLPFAPVYRPFLVLEGLGLALDTLPKYA